MNKEKFLLIASFLFLAGCGMNKDLLNQKVTLLAQEKTVATYSVDGLLQEFEIVEDMGKPVIAERFKNLCKHGLTYKSYKQGINNHTPFGTWVGYEAIIVCKHG